MFLVIILSVLYANADGNGIVKSVMENGNKWPKEGVTPYTHHLECDYRHNFPRYPSWTFTYDVHCIETKGESGEKKLTLSINCDNNVFDNFEVTTCEPTAVIKSVFSPAQKPKYTPEDEPDNLERPTVSYLKYKLKMESASLGNTSTKTQWPRRQGDLNRRSLIVKVIDYSHGKPAWTPHDEEGKKRERLLECTFDQFSHLCDLACVQGDKADEYFAFVTYQKLLLDRFTVASCEEEDIVNGIFPKKETTANPKKTDWIEKIFFCMKDGECYKREYPKFKNSGPDEEKKQEPCPDVPDKWSNPTWGKAGIWRECKGLKSVQGRAATHSHSGNQQKTGGS